MPVSLTNLRERRALATKDLGEFGQLNVWYNVGKTSPGYFQRKAKTPDKAFLIEMITDLVVDWDVTDETGETLPITEETLNELDYAFLNLVVDLMKEASDPLTRSGKR